MKKTFIISISLFILSNSTKSQSFSDNFDSYVVNQYLCTQSSQWKTWSNAPGSNEDVRVFDNNSNSPAQSLFFSSTSSSGGPVDIVLPFGAEHTTGQFTFSHWMNVQPSKSAYYNFQGKTTIGTEWSLDFYFLSNGSLQMFSAGEAVMVTNYPNNSWFEIKVEADLNTNSWELFINNVSKGIFQNGINRIASWNIYPYNPLAPYQAGFWIDDVNYNITPFTLPWINASAYYINMPGAVVGQSGTPSAKIRNLGSSVINSFTAEITYNGTTLQKNISGVSIPSMGEYAFDFSGTFNLVSGSNPVTLTVSNVNGAGADGNTADDSKTIYVNPIVPAPGKVVAVEEGTGTWCQWCPRGAVYMDRLAQKYGKYFAGIAVHNNDPMADPVYDAGIGGLVSGYPSALVDRQNSIDPSEIEAPFITRLTTPAVAFMENFAVLDTINDSLFVTVKTTYQQNGSGVYKVALVLTEDSVKGTSSGYNQSNAYAGGGNGVMGGYELLPNPVPASLMIYNHVARRISPSFAGTQGTLPSTFVSGEQFENTFKLKLNTSWKIKNMHIVSLLIAPDGKVENAGYISLEDALEYIFVSAYEHKNYFNWSVFPNPTNTNTNVRIELNESRNIEMMIYNSLGQRVGYKNYGTLNGLNDLLIQTEQLENGVYYIELNDGTKSYSKTLVVY